MTKSKHIIKKVKTKYIIGSQHRLGRDRNSRKDVDGHRYHTRSIFVKLASMQGGGVVDPVRRAWELCAGAVFATTRATPTNNDNSTGSPHPNLKYSTRLPFGEYFVRTWL